MLSRKPKGKGAPVTTKKKQVSPEALVSEDKVLCSSALNEMVSNYA